MNRIDILIAVDTAGALAAGTLQGYVYLVDTNGYLGSWQEGQSSLDTVCRDGQRLRWSVAAIDPASAVSIALFSGPLVDSRVCVPAQDPLAGGAWTGMVEARGTYASLGYTVALSLAGARLDFSAFLKVV
jgi:hypothetical protein